jgi:hypothetical protein
MKSLHYLIALITLIATTINAQSKLPIIKATSMAVAINDGGYLDKNAWSLSPKTKPDIYTADRTRQAKWVTFYTDIDSIKIKVKPGTKFDFIILLNGKDSCYTRVESAISVDKKLDEIKSMPDTIPFILTAYNAIHVKSIFNNRDTLNLHFDLGSFGFRLTRDAILQKTKLLAHQTGVFEGKAKPNYNDIEKVFKVQMGNLTWDNPEFVATGFTAREMDGRFGGNVFEGKTVEIDYEKGLIIVHPKCPKNLKSYTKSKLEFIRSFPCIKGILEIKNKQYVGDFILDTGSDKALILDSLWAVNQHFPTDLPVIKTVKFKDPRGVVYENKQVNLPMLKVSNYPLSNVPTTLLGGKNPTGFSINLMGNDALKRFNTILDFQNDVIYLKPNKFMGLAFKEAS